MGQRDHPPTAKGELTPQKIQETIIEYCGSVHEEIWDEVPSFNITNYQLGQTIVELALAHIDQGKRRKGFAEAWTAMHGKSTMESFGILARVACHLINGPHLHSNQMTFYNQITQQRADGQSANNQAG